MSWLSVLPQPVKGALSRAMTSHPVDRTLSDVVLVLLSGPGNPKCASGILGGPINMPRHFRRTDQHVLPFRPSGHEVHRAQVARTGTSVMVFVLYTRSHFRSESINMLQQIVYKEHFRNESINMLGYFRFRIPINIPLVTHTM